MCEVKQVICKEISDSLSLKKNRTYKANAGEKHLCAETKWHVERSIAPPTVKFGSCPPNYV
jgi:hypothetical protein